MGRGHRQTVILDSCLVASGEKEGAKVLCDGRDAQVADAPNGLFVGATIVDQVQNEMALAREEVFGPVLNVMRMEDEAMDLTNKSCYGNGAAIFTDSGKAAREFKHRVKAGMVGINVGVPATMAMFPFTGRGDSFHGDLHIQEKKASSFTLSRKS
jgi:malonate-semialdehyde dehydrogenase (acetylating) / methylmalonate-semialdehyde dehydrogenase